MIAWLGVAPRIAGRSTSLPLSLVGKKTLVKHGSPSRNLLCTLAQTGSRSSFYHTEKCTEQRTHLSKHTENIESEGTNVGVHVESIHADERDLNARITQYLSSPELLKKALDKVQPPLGHADFIFLAALLRSCGSSHALPQGQLVHIHIIKCEVHQTIFLQNLLLQMYGKCGAINDSYAVFSKMQQHDQFSWNFMGSAYTHNAEWDLAMDLFNQLRIEGFVVDDYILSSTISACAGKEHLQQGKHAHACLVGSEYESKEAVGNALLGLYGKCDRLTDAWTVFSNMVERSVISWSSLITSYTQHNRGKEAIGLWCRMQEEAVLPKKATMLGVIDACANQAALHIGKQVHCCLLGPLFEFDGMVSTAFVSMYGKCGDMESALKVFERLQEHNVAPWTALMAGYARLGHSKEAFQIFDRMQRSGIAPNKITYICILDAYNSREFFEKAKQMHACIKHSGFDKDVVVGTALMNMYGKCGSPRDARAMFDGMPQCNLVSWNTMLSIYAQHGHGKEAFELFRLMLGRGEPLGSVTFISMLSVCANEGALMEGKWMQDQIVRRGYCKDGVVGNALLNMYSKCGQVNSARNVFERLSERSVVSWCSMIPAYAYLGHGKEVLPMLRRMKKEGVHPNLVTFKVILSACSHAGLVDDAHECLNAMSEIFELKADAEHYACVVDLLGRAGRLDEVEKMMFSMPVQPSLLSWMMFMGACSNQADVRRAEYVASQVFEMYPECPSPYVILSNMYVAAGRDADAERLLSRMKAKGLMEREECTYIEVEGMVKEFSYVNQSYSQAKEVHAELCRLERLAADAGFTATSHRALLGLESEGIGYAACYHTERLAIAYGFLRAIHKALFVAKNAHMCSECHIFLKTISKVCDTEIIVSDSSGLHRMKDGACSCANLLMDRFCSLSQ